MPQILLHMYFSSVFCYKAFLINHTIDVERKDVWLHTTRTTMYSLEFLKFVKISTKQVILFSQACRLAFGKKISSTFKKLERKNRKKPQPHPQGSTRNMENKKRRGLGCCCRLFSYFVLDFEFLICFLFFMRFLLVLCLVFL